ncbi:MAG: hypothetical protein AB1724_05170 [Thermodesulfobacteriota bacterium]
MKYVFCPPISWVFQAGGNDESLSQGTKEFAVSIQLDQKRGSNFRACANAFNAFFPLGRRIEGDGLIKIANVIPGEVFTGIGAHMFMQAFHQPGGGSEDGEQCFSVGLG